MLFDSLCVLELVVDALVSQNVQDLALPTHCQPALLPGLDYHFTIFFPWSSRSGMRALQRFWSRNLRCLFVHILNDYCTFKLPPGQVFYKWKLVQPDFTSRTSRSSSTKITRVETGNKWKWRTYPLVGLGLVNVIDVVGEHDLETNDIIFNQFLLKNGI